MAADRPHLSGAPRCRLNRPYMAAVIDQHWIHQRTRCWPPMRLSRLTICRRLEWLPTSMRMTLRSPRAPKPCPGQHALAPYPVCLSRAGAQDKSRPPETQPARASLQTRQAVRLTLSMLPASRVCQGKPNRRTRFYRHRQR